MKTEYHCGDHAVRGVPLCPELRAMLADAFDQVVMGAALVVPLVSRRNVNLRTHLERIIARAGHDTWPRLPQKLRASCETDWVDWYPSHVVAKWLGHSPKIAAAHYLMSREHHFEDVIAGGSKAGTSSVPGEPIACDANCDSAGIRNGSQRTARNGRKCCHYSGCSGLFGNRGSYQNCRAALCRAKNSR